MTPTTPTVPGVYQLRLDHDLAHLAGATFALSSAAVSRLEGYPVAVRLAGVARLHEGLSRRALRALSSHDIEVRRHAATVFETAILLQALADCAAALPVGGARPSVSAAMSGLAQTGQRALACVFGAERRGGARNALSALDGAVALARSSQAEEPAPAVAARLETLGEILGALHRLGLARRAPQRLTGSALQGAA